MTSSPLEFYGRHLSVTGQKAKDFFLPFSTVDNKRFKLVLTIELRISNFNSKEKGHNKGEKVDVKTKEITWTHYIFHLLQLALGLLWYAGIHFIIYCFLVQSVDVG